MSAIEKLINFHLDWTGLKPEDYELGHEAAAEYAELQERLRADREALEAARDAIVSDLPGHPALRLIEASLESNDG